MSHYEYIKAIALAWIEPEEYAPQRIARKRKSREDKEVSMGSRSRRRMTQIHRSTSSSTVSGLTSIGASTNAAGGDSNRNGTINDNSLHPSSGKLRCRLNTAVQHLPEYSKVKKRRCQLHRWARDRKGEEAMSGIIRCSICRVDLCVKCYQVFHKEANLVDKKICIAAS